MRSTFCGQRVSLHPEEFKTGGRRTGCRTIGIRKLWKNREGVASEKSKSYLFTIAYHQMIDHIRKMKRVQLREEFREEARVSAAPVHALKKVLEDALSRLNETHRSLVLLKDYEGYSYSEIGQITGLNESQVKVYLHRARIQLKNYLVKVENLI